MIPEAWNTGIIVKLPQKGDFNATTGKVSLLPITSKVFSRIIHSRLAETLNEHIKQDQAGVRRWHLCSDHIFALKQILEQSKEWNAPLYANFIDFENAFHSIH